MPSAAYKRHAWLAVGGLVCFMALYLGLTAALARLVVMNFVVPLFRGGDPIAGLARSVVPAFFLAFLVRGLFWSRRAPLSTMLEVTRETQPALFAFLYRLADETSAPRPHRVFLSAQVNASVFYDLSFWNLLFPTRKNLELGLGLVNLLTLDELKAVIAHEYGHFAQRTMAVGRWVYIAQQIAGNIVGRRGLTDRFLAGLSNADVRVAWVGWILRVLVWAVRALLDAGFRVALLAYRALGREMEFQADRVAVSVSGSDSLVHALHRLGAADEAWQEAVAHALSELRAGRTVDDLFELQERTLEHLRRVLDDPAYGASPPRPAQAASHRLFDQRLAQPPKMWLTHPPSREREDSAKATYVESALDQRSAWALFADPAGLRASVTGLLFAETRASLKVEAPQAAEGTSLERLAHRYSRPAHDPSYRGAYLGRAVAAYFTSSTEMLAGETARSDDELRAALRGLYPAGLKADLQNYRERRDEESQLKGLAAGFLTAPGGIIRYRGQALDKSALPLAVATATQAREAAQARIVEHDRQCRAVHLAAARRVGAGWPEYLQSLVHLLHAATHQLRGIEQTRTYLRQLLDQVLGGGRVSDDQRSEVVNAAFDVYRELKNAWARHADFKLPEPLARRFESSGGWSVFREPLGLNAPQSTNIGDWLAVVDGWTNGALADLRDLADAALDELLDTERYVREWLDAGADATPAPPAASAPAEYEVSVIGRDLPRQRNLGWWERFQSADGLVPGLLRTAVALAVVAPALVAGAHLGDSEVHVLNGLGVPVEVRVGDANLTVAPRQVMRLTVPSSWSMTVSARTSSGEPIEQFEAVLGGAGTFVYDIASAAGLYEWSAAYGTFQRAIEPKELGAPRWLQASQHDVFAEPPRSVSLKAGQSTVRRVLASLEKERPSTQLRVVTEPAQREAMEQAHLRFDPTEDEAFQAWARAAHEDEVDDAMLIDRWRATPSLGLGRALQDSPRPATRAAVCDDPRSWSSRFTPGDARYLEIRCGADGSERAQEFFRAAQQHPDNDWLAYASLDALWLVAKPSAVIEVCVRVCAAPGLSAVRARAQLDCQRFLREARLDEQIALQPFEATDAVRAAEAPEFPSAKADDDDLQRAFHALAVGDLEGALTSLPAGARPTVLTQVAGSTGASESRVKEALVLDAAKLAPSAQLTRAALELREGRSASLPRDFKVYLGERADEAVAALKTPAPSGPTAFAALAQAEGDPMIRGFLYAFGATALGAAAPPRWRREATALLFASERPSFR